MLSFHCSTRDFEAPNHYDDGFHCGSLASAMMAVRNHIHCFVTGCGGMLNIKDLETYKYQKIPKIYLYVVQIDDEHIMGALNDCSCDWGEQYPHEHYYGCFPYWNSYENSNVPSFYCTNYDAIKLIYKIEIPMDVYVRISNQLYASNGVNVDASRDPIDFDRYTAPDLQAEYNWYIDAMAELMPQIDPLTLTDMFNIADDLDMGEI